MARRERVTGRRVYVTFNHDGTVVMHPSDCTGPLYKMRDEGSEIFGPSTSPEEMGMRLLKIRDRCKTE